MFLLRVPSFTQLVFCLQHSRFFSLPTHNYSADNMSDTCNSSLSNNVISDFHFRSSHFLKLDQDPNPGSPNVPALMQAGRQGNLALSMRFSGK